MKNLKNIFLLLAFSMTPLMAYASIGADRTSDVDTLRLQGYSESALKIMDDVKYRSQGENKSYQKRFVKKEGNAFGRGYTKVKNYVDPIQDDNTFGEHQINFSNTWNGDEPEYSTRRVDPNQVENL